MTIRFDGRVAIVTGAGAGLGRAHAFGLAARGASVVVNDVGGGPHGEGGGDAIDVVRRIEEAGGIAVPDGADVTDRAQVEAMVARAVARFGRVDILVNNAGILRDKTFANLSAEDIRAVMDVHVHGAIHCTQAVWTDMRERGYGRIVFTSSASGLYGNFGQANYAAAKMAVIGLMNVLRLEGAKYGIRVNALAPVAATRLTESFLPPGTSGLMRPEDVTHGLLYLVSEDAPSGVILAAGAGVYARTVISETEGVYLPPGERSPEQVAARFAGISGMSRLHTIDSAVEQTVRFIQRASDRTTA